MDRISAEHRSWNMSRITGKNTKPEITVRKLLRRLHIKFRTYPARVPGKPDIILPDYRTVIFIHGCFWHRHKQCKYAYTPKSRVGFWKKKFEGNVRRDKALKKELAKTSWKQITIWECQLKKLKIAEKRLLKKIVFKN